MHEEYLFERFEVVGFSRSIISDEIESLRAKGFLTVEDKHLTLTSKGRLWDPLERIPRRSKR